MHIMLIGLPQTLPRLCNVESVSISTLDVMRKLNLRRMDISLLPFRIKKRRGIKTALVPRSARRIDAQSVYV